MRLLLSTAIGKLQVRQTVSAPEALAFAKLWQHLNIVNAAAAAEAWSFSTPHLPVCTVGMNANCLFVRCNVRGSSSSSSDLNRGPEPSGPSKISQVCRHSFLAEAGVAARRATLYPTGQKFLTSWKPGCRYSMRPNDSTAGQRCFSIADVLFKIGVGTEEGIAIDGFVAL